MALTKLENTLQHLHIHYGADDFVTSRESLDLLGKIETLHAKVPLSALKVDRVTPGAEEWYEYGYVAKDGREWSEKFRITGPSPEESFEVTGWWTIAELVPGRPLREHLVAMCQVHDLTKITYNRFD